MIGNQCTGSCCSGNSDSAICISRSMDTGTLLKLRLRTTAATRFDARCFILESKPACTLGRFFPSLPYASSP